MAILYIWEFSTVRRNTQIPRAPGMSQQAVKITATVALSAPFTAATSLVLLTADSICFIGIGAGSGVTVLTDRKGPILTDSNGIILAANFGMISVSVVRNFLLVPDKIYKLGVNAGDQIAVSNSP